MTHPLATAARVAGELLELLEPACERIAIAGSIRRRKPEVKDIELVAVPRFGAVESGDLWGTEQPLDYLAVRLSELILDGELTIRDVELHRFDGSIEISHRAGPLYQALAFRGIPVDLFIVQPPREWGVIYALRTGPGDWNIELVTKAREIFRRVDQGRVLHLGKVVPCPEEADFFAALGQAWVEPEHRSPARVSLNPAKATAAA